MEVYLLWHVHEMPDGEEDSKLIGVYSSRQSAEGARSRAATWPGFRNVPDGFTIDRYALDQDHWTSGYVTVTHADTCREWKPAYVLAGGKSSRFGSDKARAILDGEPLIGRVSNALRHSCDEILAVADTPAKYADLGLETIADRRPGQGPLAGVEAALADRLSRYGEGWIVLASCDLAGLKPGWVKQIITGLDPNARAVAFRGDLWQPFPAAYHTDLLPIVSELLDTGRASFQRLLGDPRAKAAALPLPSDWPAIPQVNTREDLERFRSGS